MLLNNFRRALVGAFTNLIGISYSNLASMTNEIKKTTGTTFKYSYNYRYMPCFNNTFFTIAGLVSQSMYEGDYSATSGTGNFTSCGLALGDGNTPPTVDDYKLSGNLITGLRTQTQNTTANNNSITFSIIVTNNTNNSVTVKELGLAGCYSSGDNYYTVLLTRDVLSDPVTLNTGDSKTFSVTIDLRSLTDTTVNQ